MTTAKKGSDEVYIRLKDRGTSYHDITQGKGVVGDRVAIVKRTAHVSQFLEHGTIKEVPEDEALAALEAQETGVKATAPTKAVSKKATAPTKAVSKKATAPTKAVSKKDITSDDDDEDEDEETT